MGRLVLIPWHIGHRDDVTVRALAEVGRLRVLLVEEAALTRRQLAEDHGVDCAGKELVEVGYERDAALVKRCREWLAREDVGLLSSSGAPCFIDPGAWLVREIRGLGLPVVALAGASVLTAVMSLSGEEWGATGGGFTFRSVPRGGMAIVDDLVRTRQEALVLLLFASDATELIERVAAVDPERIVSFFFDLTKQGEGMPFADRVESASAKVWRTRAAEVAWSQASDVAAVVHGAAPRRRRGS